MKRVLIASLACLLAFFLCPLSPARAPASGQGWKVAEKDGVWWLIDPEGRPFFSKGVNIVTPGKETEKSKHGQAYCWSNFYPSLESWRKQTGERLRSWGFNTLGGWSDPSPDLGLALTVDLELGRNSKFHWFDPFRPDMEQIVTEWAQKLTAPYKDHPALIGYYSDNEVGWWNSPLFAWYLKDGWDNHTKRFLWRLIYDHYGGDWRKLLDDWSPQDGLSGFEDLKKAGARLKLRPGGYGIRLVDRFMAECAGRYYAMTAGAIHKADPRALYLGDRLPLYYHQDAVLAEAEHVDVISTNYNIMVPDGWVAPYFFEGLAGLGKKPVLVTEFFFAAEENRSGNRNETERNVHAKPRHLMTVKTQAQRAWGAGNALVNFTGYPNVVGVHWFQYADEPLGGREDGEDYNMGLVDTSNRGYEEVTESFKKLNPLLESIHRESAGRAGAGKPESPVEPVRIKKAAGKIEVGDQSLMDWDKEHTLLSGFSAPKPHVPFGNVHLAWAPEGIYLFSIADTYVDPGFLDYRGEFPSSEAFQLHLYAELNGESRHFAVYLKPQNNPEFPDGFEVVPELYKVGEKGVERLSTDGRVQRLNKSLPHMAMEAFFPAGWFGVDEFKPGTSLKMNIAMASFYREFTMSWAGDPGETSLKAPDGYRSVVLEE